MFQHHNKLRLVAILWIIFSVLYIGWNEWTRFRTYVMQQSYTQGRAEAALQLLTEAPKCQPFPVTVGDKSAAFIATECLTAAAKQEAKK